MNPVESQPDFESRMRFVQALVIGAGVLLIFVALAESRRRSKDRD
jgi:hypothetical protein